MSQKKVKPNRIIGGLREAAPLVSYRASEDEICCKIEVTQQTYYR